ISNLSHIVFTSQQHFFSFLQAYDSNKLAGGLVGQRFQFSMKLSAAHSQLPAQFLNTEQLVVQMVQHLSFDLVEKTIFLMITNNLGHAFEHSGSIFLPK